MNWSYRVPEVPASKSSWNKTVAEATTGAQANANALNADIRVRFMMCPLLGKRCDHARRVPVRRRNSRALELSSHARAATRAINQYLS
jgi:hypothetical protein